MTQETFRGVVRRVFFANPDSPWMAGVLELDDDGGEIRFGGKCFAEVGDKLEVVGAWAEHPKFGRQVEVETGLVKMDESPEALIHLLATHADFRGLGPARARGVVEAAQALAPDGNIAHALDAYSDEIATRAKVPIAIVENAAAVWNGRKTFFDALAQLGEQGWSSAQATRIVNRFGDNAASIVRSDPYALIGKLTRFGFRTVDTVALKMGISPTLPMRLGAGLTYCLDRIADDGHTWSTRSGLVAAAIEELRPDTLDGEDKIREQLEELIAVGLIVVEHSPVKGEELVADAVLAQTEVEVFDFLVHALSDVTDDLETGAITFDGPRAQAAIGTLNEGQAKASWGVWTHRAAVISGAGGVGKTYTMKALCDVAEENRLRVALCCPTGKAARKLAHATTREAKTIHRLLEPQFDEDTGAFKFMRNEGNRLNVDVVILDEISMVDIRLMRSLLRALRPSTRLVLVGDHHQIPSVGPGAILRDLLRARERYPAAVHVLTEIVRQAGDLARNTTALLDGVVVGENSEVWGIERTEKGNETAQAVLAAQIVEAVVTAPEPLNPFGREIGLAWDVQVLAPQRKGELGTYALNVHLQRLHQRLIGNPPPPETKPNQAPKPCMGDRVIWTKNDYDLDLFNGTQAIVTGLPKGGGMELFTEDGREVSIPPAKRQRVEVAFAMTIHKSQGSEWPFVILVASSAHWYMHDRNLLYTGAARASESLTILGDRNGMRHFAQEKKSAERRTFGSFFVHGWSPARAELEPDAPRHLRVLPPVGGGQSTYPEGSPEQTPTS